MRSESLEEKIRRLVREEVEIVDPDPSWPASFRRERDHLRRVLPDDLVGRIEHFGSTAVPGLAAKPIVDMLVEVRDLSEARRRIVPILEGLGYDYLWRPTFGDDVPPFDAWFIRRDADSGRRTHHLHMVEPDFHEHWDRLRLRDALIADASLARRYEALKHRLARESKHDRAAYTAGKSRFIAEVMARLRASGDSGGDG